ncbi:DUF599 domain-containing protein [Paracoccus marinus]|uniref:DUF599 domain-containing protein n=1 Tax=Paracoccus marinus TaxID=288426 RepID=UPI00103EACE6|nr:DUF599 domain-containing protein [Paracoccus marinus]GLS80763.1 membrane protein [Paracoccus marinus]
MELLDNLPLTLTAADVAALALLVVTWLGVGRLIEHPPRGRPSVSFLMKRYRRDWMFEMLTRDNRIFDGNTLTGLREGTAFFASACMIAMGGGLALVGNTEPLTGIARELDAAAIPALLLKIKLLLILGFVANAFLKFVWSHRLFGYCAIMMAAIPNDPDDRRVAVRAGAAAEININAARNFNIGLRAVYFAIGSAGWLLGPLGLVAGTVLVTSMTLRREFTSASRQAIMDDVP